MEHHINSVIPMHYEIMAQYYGAKFLLEVVHCVISSTFRHAPPCPAAFPKEPYASFTAKLAQQAL